MHRTRDMQRKEGYAKGAMQRGLCKGQAMPRTV